MVRVRSVPHGEVKPLKANIQCVRSPLVSQVGQKRYDKAVSEYQEQNPHAPPPVTSLEM